MPTLYTSEDSGLPVFSTSMAINLAKFLNLKLLFKSCLVTGYGSKPGAGWTLIDEADTHLVLRNASGKYVSLVCANVYWPVQTNLYQGFRIYLSATYTGMVNGVPQGLGVVSGTAAGNSAPHYWGSQYLYSYSTTQWRLIADSRTFVLVCLAPSNNSVTTYSGIQLDANANAGPGTLYIGDDLAGNFLAAGGVVQASVPGNFNGNITFNRDPFTTLSNPKTGLLIDTGGVAANLEGMSIAISGVGLTLDENFDVPALELAQVRWVCDRQAQAGLRGVRSDPLLKRLYSYSVKNILAGTSLPAASINLGNILTMAVLPDGHSYMPLLALNAGRQSAIVTDNPSCW